MVAGAARGRRTAMTKTLFAALAALALAVAAPARADEGGCKNCPHHAQMASADDKAGKKDADKTAKCACAGEGKECKCGEKCECPHCHAAKAAKKEEGKKT
jgi:hypothetical protein